MLRWLLDTRERYRLRKRCLFRFWDGRRWQYADPLRAMRGLHQHPTLNLAEMLPFADANQERETTIFCDAVCEVFGVTRWDGRNGLTDGELMNLFHDFVGYLAALKKNTSRPPTSSPTSDPTPSPGAAPGPATSLPADSPSMPGESVSAAPTAPCGPLSAG